MLCVYLQFCETTTSSQKWIRLWHSSGPLKTRNFYPKRFLWLPKKPQSFKRKNSHPSLKEPITQKRSSDPKISYFFPKKTIYQTINFFAARLKRPIIWPTHLTQPKKEISTQTFSDTYLSPPRTHSHTHTRKHTHTHTHTHTIMLEGKISFSKKSNFPNENNFSQLPERTKNFLHLSENLSLYTFMEKSKFFILDVFWILLC